MVLIAVLLGGMGQGVVAPKLPELLHESGALYLSSGISATLMYFAIFISTFKYGSLADEGKVHLAAGPWPALLRRFTPGSGLAPNQEHSLRIAFRRRPVRCAPSLSPPISCWEGYLPHSERGQWLAYYGVALSIGLLLGPALALAATNTVGTAAGLPPGLRPRRFFLWVSLRALSALLMSGQVFSRVCPSSRPRPRVICVLTPGALITGGVYGFMGGSAWSRSFPCWRSKISRHAGALPAHRYLECRGKFGGVGDDVLTGVARAPPQLLLVAPSRGGLRAVLCGSSVPLHRARSHLGAACFSEFWPVVCTRLGLPGCCKTCLNPLMGRFREFCSRLWAGFAVGATGDRGCVSVLWRVGPVCSNVYGRCQWPVGYCFRYPFRSK